MVTPSTTPPVKDGLNPVEAEFVAFFVQMANALSLPRSVGEIFGFLYAAEEPKPFEEVVARLGISKGSASHGLKFLSGIGAISPVYVPRDRRTFYEAETKMRKLFSNALLGSVRPHLEGNAKLLDDLELQLEDSSDDPDFAFDHYRARLGSLKSWNEKALQILPLLDKLVSLPIPPFPFRFFDGAPAPTENPHEDPGPTRSANH